MCNTLWCLTVVKKCEQTTEKFPNKSAFFSLTLFSSYKFEKVKEKKEEIVGPIRKIKMCQKIILM